METENQKTIKTKQPYYIEMVINNGITYFQQVRRRDGAILYSNISLIMVIRRISYIKQIEKEIKALQEKRDSLISNNQ